MTICPGAKPATQVAPQSMPPGSLVTRPAPVPSRDTSSTTAGSNSASVIRSPVIVRSQVADWFAQAPLHPAKADPASGVAVRVTVDPCVNTSLQSMPQSMPAGALVTVPAPVPPIVTSSEAGMGSKVAVTAADVDSVTTQSSGPVHPPPVHPANVEFASGTACSVTWVSAGNVAAHVVPQSMPAGSLVTVPAPPPARFTVNDGSGGGGNCAEVVLRLERRELPGAVHEAPRAAHFRELAADADPFPVGVREHRPHAVVLATDAGVPGGRALHHDVTRYRLDRRETGRVQAVAVGFGLPASPHPWAVRGPSMYS